jgi:predicted dehydrogenase
MKHVLLVDMVVHHIDLIRHVLGQDIARVYAEDFNPPSAEGFYEHGAALRMILTLADGTRVSYAGDWSARGHTNSWQGAWRLQCAEGAIRFDNELNGVEVSRGELWGKEITRDLRPIERGESSQRQLLAAFADSIRTGKPGLTSGRDNLKTIAAVFAAAESCETGLPVDVQL